MIDSPLAFPSGAYGQQGMTLRDYYAAVALAALLPGYKSIHEAVTDAWKTADLMVRERGE